MKIPFCTPYIGKEEKEAVSNVIDSKWIGTGGKVTEFEESIKNFIGCKTAVAVSSCTAALNICLSMMNVQPGDEIITTAYTFCSTIHAIMQHGAIPVFADIESNTCNINPVHIETKITKKTRGIIPVHFAGQPCNMDSINSIARRCGIFVIEDAAHAFGAQYKKRKIGDDSNLTCFSFYPTKTITTGEGGCICTNRNDDRWLRAYAANGILKDDPPALYRNVSCSGFKANMTNMQAAMGIEQMKKIKTILSKRAGLSILYNFMLKDLEEISLLKINPENCSSYHLYPIFLNGDLYQRRQEIINFMFDRGIECSVHYTPVTCFDYFKKNLPMEPEFYAEDLPITYDRAFREISLPLYPSMTNMDVRRVCETLKEAIK